jgi:hypothetical protein
VRLLASVTAPSLFVWSVCRARGCP